MKEKELPEHKNKIVDDGESMKKNNNDIEKEKQQFTWAAEPNHEVVAKAQCLEEPEAKARRRRNRRT